MKSKISFAIVTLFLCMGFLATNAIADSKIGVIDVQKVINTSKAGAKAQKTFKAKVEELQKGIKTDGEALIKLREEIEKKKSVWNKEKMQEKLAELQTKGRALQVKEATAQKTLQQLQNKELAPILKALEPVLEKYAKKNNYTAILDKAGVVYYDEDALITDIIIKELDKAMK